MKLWIATIAVWALGLIAAPMLVAAPYIIWMNRAYAPIRPFLIFHGVLFCLSVIWLIGALALARKHTGRARTVASAVPLAMVFIMLVVTVAVPIKNVKVTVDLPAPSRPTQN